MQFLIVIPANAGIQAAWCGKTNLDSRVRGNDMKVPYYALRAMLRSLVIPADAGIQIWSGPGVWIPAFAGMTLEDFPGN